MEDALISCKLTASQLMTTTIANDKESAWFGGGDLVRVTKSSQLFVGCFFFKTRPSSLRSMYSLNRRLTELLHPWEKLQKTAQI
jgi:hypothetical protein